MLPTDDGSTVRRLGDPPPQPANVKRVTERISEEAARDLLENPRLYRCQPDLDVARRGFLMNASDKLAKCRQLRLMKT